MKNINIKKRWLTNATANVFGGAVGALFNILLPAILIRNFTSTEFAMWSLALQVIYYVQVFSGGIQIAVARNISAADARNDRTDQLYTLGAAWRISLIIALLGCGVSVIWSSIYPLVYRDVVDSSHATLMQWVVAIIGVGASLQLISLVPAGIFIGLHQNIKWVLNQSTARILTLVALYIYSVNGAGILECAIILSLGSVIIVPFSFATLWLKDRDFNLSAITTKEKFKEIANYCTTMGFWNASVLLIGGISTTLVGIFDPKSVGSYALAVTAINVTNGVLLAILSPIGVNSAALMTEKDGSLQVKKILFKSTKILTRILISGIICYSLIGKIILTYWVGNDYAAEADSYLIILLFANCIRNMLLPLSMILLAIRDPKIGLKATIFEGVVVLLSSVLLGSKYGALGIAAATIFGAVAGAAFSAKYVMNELSDVVGSRLDFLINSIARPSLIFIPLIVLTVFLAFGHG